jgi:hypothetical protein
MQFLLVTSFINVFKCMQPECDLDRVSHTTPLQVSETKKCSGNWESPYIARISKIEHNQNTPFHLKQVNSTVRVPVCVLCSLKY